MSRKTRGRRRRTGNGTRREERQLLDQLADQAHAQSEMVYDPATPADQAAAILRAAFADEPVPPIVAATIALRGSEDRAVAVADAALGVERNPMSLSLAADVALVRGEASAAEAHVVSALACGDHPELRLRLAIARAQQERLAAAIDVVDQLLVEDPLNEAAQLMRGDVLRRLHARQVEAAADCPCGSGRSYRDCCRAGDQHALRSFQDSAPLDELRHAIAVHIGGRPALQETTARNLADWVELGAASAPELTRWADLAQADPAGPESLRLQLLSERAWWVPGGDGTGNAVEAFAADPATPEELARRALDYRHSVTWGLWEVARPEAAPGVVVTELLTGFQVYAAIPPRQLDGLARWSVLLGYLAPVDGVWRAGGGFYAMNPTEGRVLGHEVLHQLRAVARSGGRDGRELAAWARETQKAFDLLWLPELAAPASLEVRAAVHGVMGLLLPELVAFLDEVRTAGAQAPPIELPAEDAETWLAAWPDEPMAELESMAPRQVVEMEDAALPIEALLRHLEHQADVRGLAPDHTVRLRRELGLLDED